MSCGCGKAAAVIAATRARDAEYRWARDGGPTVTGDSCGGELHGPSLAALLVRVRARPGLRRNYKLACGCRVSVE